MTSAGTQVSRAAGAPGFSRRRRGPSRVPRGSRTAPNRTVRGGTTAAVPHHCSPSEEDHDHRPRPGRCTHTRQSPPVSPCQCTAARGWPSGQQKSSQGQCMWRGLSTAATRPQRLSSCFLPYTGKCKREVVRVGVAGAAPFPCRAPKLNLFSQFTVSRLFALQKTGAGFCFPSFTAPFSNPKPDSRAAPRQTKP